MSVRRVLGWSLAVLALSIGLQAADAQTPGSYDPRATLAEARVEERGILEQLALIDAQLSQVTADTLDLRTRVEELQQQRASHEAAVQDADRRLRDLESGVRSQIRSLYRIYRQGLAQVLFGADDPGELRRRGRYLLHLVKADAGRLREFMSVRDGRKAALDELDADRGRLEQARADLEIKETELREQRTVREDLLKDVRERRELSLQVLGEWDRANAAFDRQLDARTQPGQWGGSTVNPNDAWAGGMGISRTAVPTAPSSANTFRESYGRLPWPVRGRLTRRFGSGVDPATGRQSNHNGIDIAAEFAEPVRAVYRGVVRMAGPLKGLGQTVAIQHGSYTTVYAHMSGVRVRVDDTVVAGQVIGLVGNTGLTAAEGYRLTFQVRYNNSAQDPLPWLTR